MTTKKLKTNKITQAARRAISDINTEALEILLQETHTELTKRWKRSIFLHEHNRNTIHKMRFNK